MSTPRGLYARLLGSSWLQVGEPIRFPTNGSRTRSLGILYGATVANLIPVLVRWSARPTALAVDRAGIPDALRWGLGLMAGDGRRSLRWIPFGLYLRDAWPVSG